MQLTVKYFGLLRDYTLKEEEQIVIPEEVTVMGFKELINKRVPELKDKPYKVALDKKLAQDEQMITEATEIALLPPYSGG